MRLTTTYVALTLTVGALALSAAPETNPVEWKPDAAAKYLDDRMVAWFANGKKLKTGDGETTCVSCHTALPYVLARPALRRLMRVEAPTPHETHILDDVSRRVASDDAHQWLYDHTEAKKIESRGTESVLNALVLASADAQSGRTQPSASTRAALARMWETQRDDGAWDWLDFGLEPYETSDAAFFGATLGAWAHGTAPGLATETNVHAAKLRTYLKAGTPRQRLFNRTWVLLVAAKVPGLLPAAERDAIVKALETRQQSDGGWSLRDLGEWHWSKTVAPFAPPGKTDDATVAQPDAYATGLVVYALSQAGLRQRPSVGRGLAWLSSHQLDVQVGSQSWTTWRAHSLNFDREHGGEKGEPWRRMFMSDLATSFAVLALTDGH